jgi:polar amino acid transport system permease protein
MRMGKTDLPVLLPQRTLPQPTEWGAGFSTRWMTSRQAIVLMLVTGLLLAGSAFAQQGGQPRANLASLLVKWTPLVFSGFLFNLLVSIASMTIGTIAGIILGLGQISLLAPVRGTSWLATQFFRNAPWLVLLFFVMFLLPFQITIWGITIPLPAWLKAILGLSLPVMANVSEIVRGGIKSIPAGQWESAESLAFSRRQILWQIILPQAVKRMIPPWMNLYAILTMSTTLISIVGIQDGMTLVKGALVAEGRVDLYLPLYGALLLMFFCYCYPIARWTQSLERRFAVNA